MSFDDEDYANTTDLFLKNLENEETCSTHQDYWEDEMIVMEHDPEHRWGDEDDTIC